MKMVWGKESEKLGKFLQARGTLLNKEKAMTGKRSAEGVGSNWGNPQAAKKHNRREK